MPICIECSYPVPQLYHVLQGRPRDRKPAPGSTSAPTSTPASAPASASASTSETGDHVGAGGEEGGGGKGGVGGGGGGRGKKEGGGDVRLTQCPRCRRFADKYVEHDFVVLFIDLVLVKPQVYRHLLFNRLGREDDALDPSITRLGILLLLFDVYLTWTRIESAPAAQTAHSPIPSLHMLLQYAFYLSHSILTTLAQHLVVRWLARRWRRTLPTPTPNHDNPKSSSPPTSATIPPPPTPSALSTALFVSSNMKLFPLLMVVWKYDDPTNLINRGVKWAVAMQNLEALRILLGCGYWVAGALVAAGWVVAWAVGWGIRRAAGLEG